MHCGTMGSPSFSVLFFILTLPSLAFKYCSAFNLDCLFPLYPYLCLCGLIYVSLSFGLSIFGFFPFLLLMHRTFLSSLTFFSLSFRRHFVIHIRLPLFLVQILFYIPSYLFYFTSDFLSYRFYLLSLNAFVFHVWLSSIFFHRLLFMTSSSYPVLFSFVFSTVSILSQLLFVPENLQLKKCNWSK